jgi:hypothetical protein
LQEPSGITSGGTPGP